ncbi:MAG: hypothetical protein M3R27_11330 [Bacteroidota bacterium]|nr:hypothetical protein [Bacteroidota bacterium]
MKYKFILSLVFFFKLLGLFAQDEEITDEIKMMKFSASGHIGTGRSADYLPCFEPFYFKIATDELEGKRITGVRVSFYDSKGNSGTLITPAENIKHESSKESEVNNRKIGLYSTKIGIKKTKRIQVVEGSSGKKGGNLIVTKDTIFTIYDSVKTEVPFLTHSLYTQEDGFLIPRKFSSVPSSKKELLIFVDAKLNAHRYYYVDYEFDVVDEEGTPEQKKNSEKVLAGTLRIYSTALKKDIRNVEAYTGLGFPVFAMKNFTEPKVGFSFMAGAKIHFRPVYLHPMRSRYSLHPGYSRFSFTLGAALGKLTYRNSEIKEISDFVNPVFGFDFELNPYVSINPGVILGMQDSGLESVSERRLVAGVFLSLNITPSVFIQTAKNSSGFKFPTGTAGQ